MIRTLWKRKGCGVQTYPDVTLHVCNNDAEMWAQPGGKTNINEKADARIRLLLKETKQTASWTDVSLCFPVNNIFFITLLLFEKESSSRALTFAVIGRWEVGEFPQQPSLLSVPAEARPTNSQWDPTCFNLWLTRLLYVTVMLELLNVTSDHHHFLGLIFRATTNSDLLMIHLFVVFVITVKCQKTMS